MIRALVPCTLAKTERILSSPRLKSPKVLQVLVSAFKHEFGERVGRSVSVEVAGSERDEGYLD